MKCAKELILTFCVCAVGIFSLPYIVRFLYIFGEKYGGIPTYLTEKEMVSYLATAIGAAGSIFVGTIAILQTCQLDDINNAPNIVISEIANDPMFDFSDSPLKKFDGRIYSIGDVDKKMRFYFKFHILEKSIDELIVSDFVVYRKENYGKKKIATLPNIKIPDEVNGENLFLAANSQFQIRYSTDYIDLGKSYVASFTTKCKTLNGYWYKKNWHMIFIYSIYDCITVKPVEGGSWKKCKRRKDNHYGLS